MVYNLLGEGHDEWDVLRMDILGVEYHTGLEYLYVETMDSVMCLDGDRYTVDAVQVKGVLVPVVVS
jgi:hypothetical protein